MKNVSSSNSEKALVPKLRFPEFTDEWEKIKLSDFSTRVIRKNKNNETQLPLTISSKDGLVDQITYFNKKVSSIDMSGYYLLKKGEFAYNKSYSVGYDYGSIKRLDKYDCGALSTLYICFSLNKFNSDFMKVYFDSLKWYKEIYMIAAEGARNHGLLNIPTNDFFNTLHYLPQNPKEQEKIAKFMLLLEKRIQLQQQLIENLKLYKRGCFLHLYNHFDKSELLFKDIYLQASEGGTPSTNNHNNYDNGNIPFVKIDDLSSRYLYNTKHHITQQGLDNSSAWIVPSENIIFSNGATIGSCSINKIPVATKQGILGIVLKETFDREYIYFYLTSSFFAKKIKKITTKGTMDCAYLKDINKIHISIPSIENQKNISRIVGKIEDIIEIEQSKMDKFIKMKNALLNLMFI